MPGNCANAGRFPKAVIVRDDLLALYNLREAIKLLQ
jgi:hypothetical protein